MSARDASKAGFPSMAACTISSRISMGVRTSRFKGCCPVTTQRTLSSPSAARPLQPGSGGRGEAGQRYSEDAVSPAIRVIAPMRTLSPCLAPARRSASSTPSRSRMRWKRRTASGTPSRSFRRRARWPPAHAPGARASASTRKASLPHPAGRPEPGRFRSGAARQHRLHRCRSTPRSVRASAETRSTRTPSCGSEPPARGDGPAHRLIDLVDRHDLWPGLQAAGRTAPARR